MRINLFFIFILVSYIFSQDKCITTDEYSDRVNDGIMTMNNKIEDVIIESVMNGIKGKKRVGSQYTKAN